MRTLQKLPSGGRVTVVGKAAAKQQSRSVKISDDIHHEIRILAVTYRLSMQTIMDRLLTAGLDAKLDFSK